MTFWEGPSGIAWIAVPTKLMVYHRRSIGVGPAFSSSFLLPLLFSLPLSLFLLGPAPDLLPGLLVRIPINPPWCVHVGIAWSVEVISLIASVVSLTTVAVLLTV